VILEGFARIFFCKLLCLSDGSIHVGYMIMVETAVSCNGGYSNIISDYLSSPGGNAIKIPSGSSQSIWHDSI
jgi:hypothetical protein